METIDKMTIESLPFGDAVFGPLSVSSYPQHRAIGIAETDPWNELWMVTVASEREDFWSDELLYYLDQIFVDLKDVTLGDSCHQVTKVEDWIYPDPHSVPHPLECP